MSQTTLLRLPQVIARVGLKRSAILRRVKCGEFPRPVRLGPRTNAWKSDEIDKWIEERPLATASAS